MQYSLTAAVTELKHIWIEKKIHYWSPKWWKIDTAENVCRVELNRAQQDVLSAYANQSKITYWYFRNGSQLLWDFLYGTFVYWSWHLMGWWVLCFDNGIWSFLRGFTPSSRGWKPCSRHQTCLKVVYIYLLCQGILAFWHSCFCVGTF